MWTETETKIGIRCELCVLFVLQGDTRVLIYEIVTDAPYFFECSSFSSPEPHKVPYIILHACLLQTCAISVMLTLPDCFLSAGLGLSAQDGVQRARCRDSCGTHAHQEHRRASGLQSATGQGEPAAPPSGHMPHNFLPRGYF